MVPVGLLRFSLSKTQLMEANPMTGKPTQFSTALPPIGSA
jgi:hypothetical protein